MAPPGTVFEKFGVKEKSLDPYKTGTGSSRPQMFRLIGRGHQALPAVEMRFACDVRSGRNSTFNFRHLTYVHFQRNESAKVTIFRKSTPSISTSGRQISLKFLGYSRGPHKVSSTANWTNSDSEIRNICPFMCSKMKFSKRHSCPIWGDIDPVQKPFILGYRSPSGTVVIWWLRAP